MKKLAFLFSFVVLAAGVSMAQQAKSVRQATPTRAVAKSTKAAPAQKIVAGEPAKGETKAVVKPTQVRPTRVAVAPKAKPVQAKPSPKASTLQPAKQN